MKPVFQTIIDRGRGNCLTACLASLLHRELHEVPNFAADAEDAGENDTGFWDRLYAWLDTQGYTYVSLHGTEALDYRGLRGQHCVMSVPSQRNPGGTHAVVGQFVPGELPGSLQLIVVHDPQSTNQPYGYVEPSFVSFLVPRLPR